MSLEEKWLGDEDPLVSTAPQCEKCLFRQEDPFVCKVYPSGKPSFILLSKRECPGFKAKSPLKLIFAHDAQRDIVGGIFGHCVGDFIGVPVEFKGRDEREKDPVKEMRAYGTYHQYFGTWSDDTSLTLCLLESLSNGYNLNELAKKFVKYLREGYWTPEKKVFDIGRTTEAAILNLEKGVSPFESGLKSEKDNGNGSLMRILPAAYYLKNEKDAAVKIKVITELSSITHRHPISILACIFYVEVLINILSGQPPFSAYGSAIEFVNRECSKSFAEVFPAFSRILSGTINLLPMNQIKSGGFVIDTLEAAIWCFLKTTSYQEAVLTAVNLGEDTDTTAAVAGALAGIHYKITSIPENWLNMTARKEDIMNLCKTFSDKISK